MDPGHGSCWKCGQRVRQDEVVRRSVLSGWSIGRFGPRAYFHRVNLCQKCDKHRKRSHRAGWLVVVAVLIVPALVVGLSEHSTPSAVTTATTLVTSTTTPTTTSQVTTTTEPFGLTTLPTCRPAPCADVHGLVVLVTSFQPDYAPWSDGFRLARLVIAYKDISGESYYNPNIDISLLDPTGSFANGPGVTAHVPPGCHFGEANAGSLAPGGTAGPFQMCFTVGGPLHGRMALVYQGNSGFCDEAVADMAKLRPSRSGSLFNDNVYGCQAVLVGL